MLPWCYYHAWYLGLSSVEIEQQLELAIFAIQYHGFEARARKNDV